MQLGQWSLNCVVFSWWIYARTKDIAKRELRLRNNDFVTGKSNRPSGSWFFCQGYIYNFAISALVALFMQERERYGRLVLAPYELNRYTAPGCFNDMDIAAIKKLITEAYAVTDGVIVFPKFSTQFVFGEKELLVRIPIYECQPPPKPLTTLIIRVICLVAPELNKKQQDLEQDLLAAAEGKRIAGTKLDIRGIIMSTTVTGGNSAHAVTECRVLIRENATTQPSEDTSLWHFGSV